MEIVVIDRLELAFAPRPWKFAEERRAEIDTHFAQAQRKKPALWNGQVMLLADPVIEAGVLRGSFLPCDFASFLTWLDFGCPGSDVVNCFAQGALRSRDGAWLMGVMGPHTANAGQIYFPSGTPDLSDVVGDRVDLEAGVWREVTEETGLTPRDLATDTGWIGVRFGPRLALMKTMRAEADADTLRAQILKHLAAETDPELSGIRIVRGRQDLDPMMRDFVVAYLDHVWGESS